MKQRKKYIEKFIPRDKPQYSKNGIMLVSERKPRPKEFLESEW